MPAGVQHEPRHEAVPGLRGQVVAPRREVGVPLVVRLEGGERLDVGDSTAVGHVGERAGELAEARVVRVRAGRGADDEGGQVAGLGDVEDVREVEAAARDGEACRDIVPAERDDEAVVDVRGVGEPPVDLALPACAERCRGLAGHGEHVVRERPGRLRARDDATDPAEGLGVSGACRQLVADDADPHFLPAHVSSLLWYRILPIVRHDARPGRQHAGLWVARLGRWT